MLSYAKWKVRPNRTEETFEQWVTNRFGGRLFWHFFKSYTEKVWGIPCNEIRADWAAQRIKNLSLRKAIWNAMIGSNDTHQPDREVRLSAARPGHDVGSLPRPGRGKGRRSPDGAEGPPDLPRRQQASAPSRSRMPTARAYDFSADEFISSMPISAAGRKHGSAGARPRASKPRNSSATATS